MENQNLDKLIDTKWKGKFLYGALRDPKVWKLIDLKKLPEIKQLMKTYKITKKLDIVCRIYVEFIIKSPQGSKSKSPQGNKFKSPQRSFHIPEILDPSLNPEKIRKILDLGVQKIVYVAPEIQSKMNVSNSNSKCEKNVIKKKLLGEGHYGKVYIGCLKETCQYVLKYQTIHKDIRELTFWNEVSSHVYVNEHAPKVTPKIYAAWECKQNGFRFGVSLLEKMDGSLEDLLDEDDAIVSSTDLYKQIQEHLTALRKIKVLHNDLKIDNILYNKKGDKYLFKFADWGLSVIFNQKDSSQYPRYTKGIYPKGKYVEYISVGRDIWTSFPKYYDDSYLQYSMLFSYQANRLLLPKERWNELLPGGHLFKELASNDDKKYDIVSASFCYRFNEEKLCRKALLNSNNANKIIKDLLKEIEYYP